MARKAEFTRTKRTKLFNEERDRLSKIEGYFTAEHDLIIVRRLLDDLAFLYLQMEEAKETILQDGIVETYQNGANQSGKKKSSAVDTYDKAVNNRLKIIRQLVDLLPRSSAQEQGGEAGELAEFIKNGS